MKKFIKNLDLSNIEEETIIHLFVFARAIGLFDKDKSMIVKKLNVNAKMKVCDIAYMFL